MSSGQAGPSNGNKVNEVQREVDEVIGVMQNNIDKVVTRGEKLDALQDKTDDLQQGAMQFKKGATKVRKQMWYVRATAWEPSNIFYQVERHEVENGKHRE